MNSWEFVAELRKRIAKLSMTVESQAWGTLGIVLGYLVWNGLNNVGKAWLGAPELCGISYAIAVVAYALISRSLFVLRRCLLNARLLFQGEAVTESEYNKMRSKCLKKAGAV